MSSSVTPIELSPVSDVVADDASLTVTLADGRVISTPLDWFPRLAHATPAERADWESIGDGEAIRWRQLDEDISVEGLIAGRKSGECAASLKRWMAVQSRLRGMPRDYCQLRREVVSLGPATAQKIEEQINRSVLGDEDCDARLWTVAVAADPFSLMKQRGATEELAVAAYVYQAESTQAALHVGQWCVSRGMIEQSTPADDSTVYVAVYSIELGRKWSSPTF